MGYVKTYRNSKNLINPENVYRLDYSSLSPASSAYEPGENWRYSPGAATPGCCYRIPVKPSTTYTLQYYDDSDSPTIIWRISETDSSNIPTAQIPVPCTKIVYEEQAPTDGSTFTTSADTNYLVIQISRSKASTVSIFCTLVGLYDGTVAPNSIEPYNTTDWYDWIKRKTASGWTDGESEKAPF